MKIANVIYDDDLVNHDMVDYINYYKGSTKYSEIDSSLPTLYVGWKFMKSSNQDSDLLCCAEILNTDIIPNKLYWEFSFSEDKSKHVKGVNNFVNQAPLYYFKENYDYKSLDPVFLNINSINDIKSHIPKIIDYLYNFKNEMLYCLSDNKIFGINLKTYEFFGFSCDEIIELISKRTEIKINDLDGTEHQHYYRKMPNFSYLKRYLVVILSN